MGVPLAESISMQLYLCKLQIVDFLSLKIDYHLPGDSL